MPTAIGLVSLTHLLDIALVLVAVMAVFSLLVVAANELIAALLNLRGRMLLGALRRLWVSPTAADAFLSHGLIASLQKRQRLAIGQRASEALSRSRFPSYLDAHRFAQVVVANALKKNGDGEPDWSSLLDDSGGKLAEQLEALWLNAGGDIAKFEAHVVEWYDSYMQRVSGWYRRQVLYISFGVSLVLAVTFHIDPIRITRQLASSPQVAEHTAQQVLLISQQADSLRVLLGQLSATVDRLPAHTTQATDTPAEKDTLAGAQSPNQPTYAQTTQMGIVAKDLLPRIELTQAVYTLLRSVLEKSIPIGWSNVGNCGLSAQPADLAGDTLAQAQLLVIKRFNTLLESQTSGPGNQVAYPNAEGYRVCEPFSAWSLAGWLLTALLTSLGAPFWFAQLQRLARVRASGPPPTRHTPAAGSGSAGVRP